MSAYDDVIQRSAGMCEGMVLVDQVWTRCGRRPVHIHHRLRRSHGGELLDQVGETYHLVVLCHRHHQMVHSAEARDIDHEFLLQGNVYQGWPRPIYVGPDSYLMHKYGETDEAR